MLYTLEIQQGSGESPRLGLLKHLHFKAICTSLPQGSWHSMESESHVQYKLWFSWTQKLYRTPSLLTHPLHLCYFIQMCLSGRQALNWSQWSLPPGICGVLLHWKWAGHGDRWQSDSLLLPKCGCNNINYRERQRGKGGGLPQFWGKPAVIFWTALWEAQVARIWYLKLTASEDLKPANKA